MPGTYKSDAVWHNFKPSDFPTMALGGRRDHPSRAYFYEWLARQARQSAPRLTWCDVGVLSMVDYLNVRRRRTTSRSEEHTSELQSLAYLVCRLLLEKKKK